MEIEAQLVYGYGVTASEVLHGAGEERLREEKSAEPEIVGFAVVVPDLERNRTTLQYIMCILISTKRKCLSTTDYNLSTVSIEKITFDLSLLRTTVRNRTLKEINTVTYGIVIYILQEKIIIMEAYKKKRRIIVTLKKAILMEHNKFVPFYNEKKSIKSLN